MSRAFKTSVCFGGATLFFAIFGIIYEMFSHQVYSNFMIFAFAIPLAGGVLPFFLAGLRKWQLPPRAVTQLYGGGVMMLTLGSVVRGVLDIYGTTNSKIIFYPIAGGIMIAAAVILAIVYKKMGAGSGEEGMLAHS